MQRVPRRFAHDVAACALACAGTTHVEDTVFSQRLHRWRRRLSLDRLRRESERSGDPLAIDLMADDGRSIPPIDRLIAVILLQAAHDRALAIHLFRNDEGRLEMFYCLAIPPTLPHDGACSAPETPWPDWLRPPDASWLRTWFEMVAPPPEAAARLFERLHWYAGMRSGVTSGTLRLRFDGRDLTAAVAAPRPDDVRIYFGSERPPIRPQLERQSAQLGRPPE